MNRDALVWGRYVAVAGAYAACYELTRNFSFSHWMLTAGLRMACLLLVPRKFWPALAVGEALPIAEMAFVHMSDYGVAWAVANTVPPIVFCMPIVAWLQSRLPIIRAGGEVNIGMIVLATLLCAVMNAAENSVVLSLIRMDDGSPAPSVTPQIFLAWFLGLYLGALTLTPSILALRERLAAQPKRTVTWDAIRHSTLARDLLLIAVPSLALLMGIASQTEGTALQVTRMAMALPVVALTLRHGWHGTSLGGLFASVAMASTSFSLLDPAMIQAQTVIAFVLSTSLLFGVRVARRQAAARQVLLAQDLSSGFHRH
ncbi:MASE1 protein [Luteibacter sp. 329MFSha]|nr:MASE1 protein [Luteibacter sp. 329MFSha]